MQIKHLHSWQVSPKEAASIQSRLAGLVQFCPLPKRIQTAAGLDCAFSGDGLQMAAVIVVLSFPQLEVLEVVQAQDKVRFPYVPGLLSFREAPVCLKAAEKLKIRPDVFLIDGQGVAHPRRLGLASHLGLCLDAPAIGCAKSRLCGVYEEPQTEKGSWSPLWVDGQPAGAVVRTRRGVKPLFVSVGHRAVLEEAVDFVLGCCRRCRLPEPTRLAHQQVSLLKKQL
ncbi:MAG TPA: deoxyribonuclease V [Anaerohalosphaeraceae bacterium]|nr:deoxyribonuclease V [Anaerohalosphaeraceae bacterium]